ncbi:hypothetical protein DFH27DRAFT_548024 [Peziza echinospora]|nr:hypothetical protein DFH27DRAFT_548024 [Peziza echinospora]
MATYTLTVDIDSKVLGYGSDDSLCLAKKVNGIYNVIYQHASPRPKVGDVKLAHSNTFQWEDKYQVFFTSAFGEGALIRADTTRRDIKFGQLATFEGNDLQPAIKVSKDIIANSDSTFAVKNAPTKFHVVVAASTGGGSYSTIYVDPSVHMGSSKILLEPKNEYVVFWRNVTETEAITAISESESYSFSFEPGVTEKRIRFGFANENQPNSGEETPEWWE